MASLETNFGTNVRRLRTNLGITQTELGEQLGYSEKTVSKWERGASLPSVNTMYGVANFFKVKLDDLLKENGLYFLGIDGGGTKTHLVLTDSSMNVMRELQTESCNPIDIKIENTEKILKDAIYTICEDVSLSNVVMYAGISGGTSHDMKGRLRDFFKSFGFRTFKNDNDLQNIIAAGLGHSDGIAVILGTGFCIFSQKSGVQKRFGGWGYFFDDGGSAFNIARDGIAAHFRAVDGIDERSLISDIIEKSYPDPQILLGKLYSEGKKGVAFFASVVIEAAEKNDRTAMEIVTRNMKYVVRAIRHAAKDFGENVPIVIAGGLTTAKIIPEYLSAEFGDEKYDIKILTDLPVYGALKCAAELAKERNFL